MQEYQNYFKNRNISQEYYSAFTLPAFITPFLPAKEKRILDVGCGLGHWLAALKKKVFLQIYGIDICKDAVEFCRDRGLAVGKISSLRDYCYTFNGHKFDFIILSHVLEHIKKDEIIESLQLVRKHLLDEKGRLLILVPNASSNTGAYWAYEDFTHETLFTAESLLFVLKAAGFKDVIFLDPDGVEGSNLIVRWIKLILLAFYKLNFDVWNLVTNSSFHRPSPRIFTYELKAVAIF